jgi:hypothetical protein
MEDYESVAAQAIRLNDRAREAANSLRLAQAMTHADVRGRLMNKLNSYEALARGGNHFANSQAEIISANLVKYDEELRDAEAKRAGSLALLQTHYEEHPDEYMQMAREVAVREGFTRFLSDSAVGTELPPESN